MSHQQIEAETIIVKFLEITSDVNNSKVFREMLSAFLEKKMNLTLLPSEYIRMINTLGETLIEVLALCKEEDIKPRTCLMLHTMFLAGFTLAHINQEESDAKDI